MNMDINGRPDLRQHDNLLVSMSRLNKYDKLNGRATGEKNKFTWARHPTGLLQATNRTAINAMGVTAGLAKEATKFVGKKAYNLLWKPQEEVAPAPIINEKVPIPKALVDAENVTRGIKKEIKALSKDLNVCEGFINKSGNTEDDIKALILVRSDLEHLMTEMKASKSGLINLMGTYGYEKSSWKQTLLLKTEKYTKAVENLASACETFDNNMEQTQKLLDKLNEKIPPQNPNPSQNIGGAWREGLDVPASRGKPIGNQFIQSVPKDFPSLEMEGGSNNFLVSFSNFLSNPMYNIQDSDRQLCCDNSGRLSLQGEYPSNRADIDNFFQMITETYGSEARNVLINILKTQDWTTLTLGNVKLVLAMLPVVVNPRMTSGLRGNENCFSILPEDERKKLNESEPRREEKIQISGFFAFTHMVDENGKVCLIKETLPNEFQAALTLFNADLKLRTIRDEIQNRSEASRPKKHQPRQTRHAEAGDKRNQPRVESESKKEPADPLYTGNKSSIPPLSGSSQIPSAPPPPPAGGPPPPPPPPMGGIPSIPVGGAPKPAMSAQEKHDLSEEKNMERARSTRASPEPFLTRQVNQVNVQKQEAVVSTLQAVAQSAPDNKEIQNQLNKALADLAEIKLGDVEFRGLKSTNFSDALNALTNNELMLILGLFYTNNRETQSTQDSNNNELIGISIDLYNNDRPEDPIFTKTKEEITKNRSQWENFLLARGGHETALLQQLRNRLSNKAQEPVYVAKKYDPNKKVGAAKVSASAAKPFDPSEITKRKPRGGAFVDPFADKRVEGPTKVDFIGGLKKANIKQREFTSAEIDSEFAKEKIGILSKKAEAVVRDPIARADKTTVLESKINDVLREITEAQTIDQPTVELEKKLDDLKIELEIVKSAKSFISNPELDNPDAAFFINKYNMDEIDTAAWELVARKIPHETLEKHRNP